MESASVSHLPRAAPRRPPRPPEVPVVGVPLAVSDYDRTIDWIEGVVAERGRAIVAPAAVQLVMMAREDPATRAATCRDDVLVLPDGQPLVWALRLLGHRASRLYGPDLMTLFCERARSTGIRMYLYGGRNQGALVQLTTELRRRHPGARIVGGYSPPYRELTAEEEDWVAADIVRSGADVVWVGIGQPRQQQWMARMRDRIDAPVLIGVGAAFDFHAGLVPQAPRWLMDAGLEWAFRLLQEPRRLWRRYWRYNPRFVRAFVRQLLDGRT